MSDKKFYRHLIREKFCKGCNICVAYCPKKVLELRDGKVFAARPDDCIGCLMCELRCPDFAIEVKPRDAVAANGADDHVVDLQVPPEAHHA